MLVILHWRAIVRRRSFTRITYDGCCGRLCLYIVSAAACTEVSERPTEVAWLLMLARYRRPNSAIIHNTNIIYIKCESVCGFTEDGSYMQCRRLSLIPVRTRRRRVAVARQAMINRDRMRFFALSNSAKTVKNRTRTYHYYYY